MKKRLWVLLLNLVPLLIVLVLNQLFNGNVALQIAVLAIYFAVHSYIVLKFLMKTVTHDVEKTKRILNWDFSDEEDSSALQSENVFLRFVAQVYQNLRNYFIHFDQEFTDVEDIIGKLDGVIDETEKAFLKKKAEKMKVDSWVATQIIEEVIALEKGASGEKPK